MAPTIEQPSEQGVITVAHPNAMFTVHLTDGRDVSASLSGKLRTYHTRLSEGDRVQVQLSPYDQRQGRIVARDRSEGDDPGAPQRVLR